MNKSFKAATIRQSFCDNMKPRFVVILDQDAAEILGETNLRYVFETLPMAEWFAQDMQSKFEELHDEALAD